MRRITMSAVAILLAAATATAFDTSTRPIRIALLPPLERFDDRRDAQLSDDLRNALRAELNRLGYDAFLTDQDRPDADFYVDVAGAGGGARPVGGVGVGGRNAGVEVAVVVSRVAATMKLYDGRTLEPMQTFDLQKRNTAVAPTAIAIGGRSAWGFLAVPIVPIVEWSQYRAGVRAVARDAAKQVHEALRR